MDAELAGNLPQPDLAGELMGLLGQLAALPVGSRPAPMDSSGRADPVARRR
jgi:hypothetical protein